MKTIKKLIKNKLIQMNLKPFKTVILSTGIICEHYRNGGVNVI